MGLLLVWYDITTWPTGAQIIITLLSIIIASGLIVLLFFSIKKERRKYKEEKLNFIEGILSKSEITSEVNRYISRISLDTNFALAFFTIDKIEEISGAFGESTVKSVVENVASKLLKALSYRVQVGRYSIDTFLLHFRSEYDRAEVIDMLNQLRNTIRDSISVNGADVNITCSVGLVFFPKDGQNTKQLTDSLQIASYMAYKEGGNKIVVYSQEMAQEEGEKVQYYTQVKRAAENKEFVLYYQPVIDFKNGKVIAAEALLRWNHPELGVLNPTKFINILEQSGDIYFIATWSLELMIEAYNSIRREFALADFELSMNLSPKQLLSESLAMDFQRILKKYKTTGKNLIVEMSEFLIFEQQEVVRSNILKLKQLGFKIAVDGFALDNNTLMKIKDFPIDIIKIDSNSLVDEDNTYLQQRLTELLIDHAKQNNIDIILERVEDKSTVLLAQTEGILKGQGYYFSKPVDFEEFMKYMLDDSQNLAKVSDNVELSEIHLDEQIQEHLEEQLQEDIKMVEELKETQVVEEEVVSTPTKDKNKKAKKKKDQETVSEN